MDLPHIETYLRPTTWDELADWQPDWAWLAGGTWLFSEPQPQVRALVDLRGLGWSELDIAEEGLTLGATCTLSQLLRASYPPTWPGIAALQSAARELASFKIQNEATIAGNLCLALPAGTFAPALLALQARYEIWPRQGRPYWLAAGAFQLGARQTVLQPGDVLRRIFIPAAALTWRTDYQRLCVATAGLAVAIAVAAVDPVTERVRLSTGASTPTPHLFEFPHRPQQPELAAALDSLPVAMFLNDAMASAAYRRQMTAVLMGRAVAALAP